MSNILVGTIKWFNNKKGFGVVETDDIQTYFVHQKYIKSQSKNFRYLGENERIRFEVKQIKGKQSAINIEPVEESFQFEINEINKGKKQKRKKRKKKNTESFTPDHEQPDMRIVNTVVNLNDEKYKKPIHDNDVLLINGLFSSEEDPDIYNKLIEEMKQCNVNEKDLWKLWHGDTHFIADDKKHWKSQCPTFSKVIDKIKNFFNMDVKATRFNWYKDTKQWKPFHHDAAAIKKDKKETQNFTVGVSFGVEREAAFEHAKTHTKISIPLPNGSVYCFGKEVNVKWRHGILQLPPEQQSNDGRISVIAWGWVDMK